MALIRSKEMQWNTNWGYWDWNTGALPLKLRLRGQKGCCNILPPFKVWGWSQWGRTRAGRETQTLFELLIKPFLKPSSLTFQLLMSTLLLCAKVRLIWIFFSSSVTESNDTGILLLLLLIFTLRPVSPSAQWKWKSDRIWIQLYFIPNHAYYSPGLISPIAVTMKKLWRIKGKQEMKP